MTAYTDDVTAAVSLAMEKFGWYFWSSYGT